MPRAPAYHVMSRKTYRWNKRMKDGEKGRKIYVERILENALVEGR
jgi:hypothetical protein